MNLRVGILTFVWSRNYGAKLQAWALQYFISSLGYECEIINFRRRHDCRFRVILRLLKKGRVGQCAKEILIDCLKWRKHSRLGAFTKQQMRLSPKTCFSLDHLSNHSLRYDAIICGSDQVWNSELTLESQPCYLLDFPVRNELLRISYAASIGKSFINETMLETFSRCLKKFDFISVREKNAVDLIKSLADKKVSSVLDPTLLLSREQWLSLCAEVDIKEPYLLVYSIGSQEASPKFKNLVEQVAHRRGLRIVTFHRKKHFHNEISRVPDAGPNEFLGLFSKASFIVTNSFHGTAFSIIFKKPFFCMRPDNKNFRQKDLLDALDIGDRLIDNAPITDKQIDSEINYFCTDKKLQVLQGSSIEFLKSSLPRNVFLENRA